MGRRPTDPLVYAPAALAVGALAFSARPARATPPTDQPTGPMIVVVTPEALRNMGVTGQRPQMYAEPISRWLNFFEINTASRVAHFFGQIMHECSRLDAMRELGTRVSARSNYAGRGLTQLTGDVRHNLPGNYAEYNRYLARRDRADRIEVPQVDVVRTPSHVENLPYSVHSAMWYWDKENANRFGDLPVTRENVRTIIARILRPAADAYHTDRRLGYARAALDQIDLGTITFLPSPAVPETPAAAFPAIIKGGGRLVKDVGAPSKTLGLLTRGEEVTGSGLIALGLLAGIVVLPGLRG